MSVYRQVCQSGPNGYTRDLMWCAEHSDIAWRYDDGSVTCLWSVTVESSGDEHVLIELDRADDLEEVSNQSVVGDGR